MATAYNKGWWQKMGGNLACTKNLSAICLTVFQECAAKLLNSWCLLAAKLMAIMESAHASWKYWEVNWEPASALI